MLRSVGGGYLLCRLHISTRSQSTEAAPVTGAISATKETVHWKVSLKSTSRLFVCQNLRNDKQSRAKTNYDNTATTYAAVEQSKEVNDKSVN